MTSILKKVFTKKQKPNNTMETVPIQTSPLSEDRVEANEDYHFSIRPSQLLVSSGQSDGMQRDHNEDTLFTLNSVIADGVGDLSLGIFIVADGMGGHRNGKIASSVATKVVSSQLVKKVYAHFLDLAKVSFSESLQEMVKDAIHEAHQKVLQLAPGGGTTLTCALVIGDQVTIGHIGDSRAYAIHHDGRMQKLTTDHSLVQRMVELEEISEEEAAIHPQRNVLLKALGQTENVFPDIQTFPIPKNGNLLLCSDGLWGVVSEKELLKIIKREALLSDACKKMVETANSLGGPDNISIILIKCIG